MRWCPLKSRKEIQKIFKEFHLEKVRINVGGIQAEVSFKNPDKDAAWELYVEMLTRIITQQLPSKSGDEETALESIYSLFPTTRDILRHHGRSATEFTKVAIPILNQIIRPFTTKWHKEKMMGSFTDECKRQEFRKELDVLLNDLRNYSRMLADIAGVEDITDMERNEQS